MADETVLTNTELAAVGSFVILLFIGSYLFGAYVFYRIGRKFGIGSFGAYCVPVYNIVLLCRCGGISGWVAAGPMLAFWGAGLLPLLSAGWLLLNLVGAGFWVYIWGSIAQRLGKNFWLWGVGCVLALGIPVFFLAFDSSAPVHVPRQRERTYKSDKAVVYEAEFPNAEPTTWDSAYEAVYEIPMLDGAPLVVRCTAGEYAGQTMELPRDGIVIGRDPARAHLVLQSPEVSGSHVRIAPNAADGNSITVTDLGSTNGTYVWVIVDGGGPWQQVRGTYSDSLPCRVRLGDGAAEFEIASQDSHRLYS